MYNNWTARIIYMFANSKRVYLAFVSLNAQEKRETKSSDNDRSHVQSIQIRKTTETH